MEIFVKRPDVLLFDYLQLYVKIVIDTIQASTNLW